MFGSVSALGIKLSSVIQCGYFRFCHNKIFLFQAKSALMCGWVEGTAPGDNLPGYVVVLVGVLQCPDVVAQCCLGG